MIEQELPPKFDLRQRTYLLLKVHGQFGGDLISSIAVDRDSTLADAVMDL